MIRIIVVIFYERFWLEVYRIDSNCCCWGFPMDGDECLFLVSGMKEDLYARKFNPTSFRVHPLVVQQYYLLANRRLVKANILFQDNFRGFSIGTPTIREQGPSLRQGKES